MNDNSGRDLRGTLVSHVPFLCLLPAVVWPIIFLCVPVLAIIIFSVGAGVAETSLLAQYACILNQEHFTVIGRSLFLGISVAVGCLICVYPIAYFIAIQAQRWGKLLLLFLMIPLWTNFLVQVYGWQFLIERNGLVNTILLKLSCIDHPIMFSHSIFMVAVVMIYCYIPFMFVPLYSMFSSFDKRLLEASADLGASTAKTFMRVTLPLSLSGIRTGVLLTFVLGFGEFAIPAVVGGGKFMTVGSLITYYFLVVGDIGLGAAFTCLSGVILLIAASLIYVGVNSLCKKYMEGLR